MSSEFAYSVPDLSPAARYYGTPDPGDQHSQAHRYGGFVGGGASEQQSPRGGRRASQSVTFDDLPNGDGKLGGEERPGTAGGPSPRPPHLQRQQHLQQQQQQHQQQMSMQPPQYPPPFGSYGFGGHLNVNLRNTRPMTAPSSVSAPYFQGALYSPQTPSNGPAPYYQPATTHVETLQYPSTFQYQVDSANSANSVGYGDAETQRARGFSLPDLVGLPLAPQQAPHADSNGQFSDDPRYSSGGSDGRASPSSSGGPFLYAPPPRPIVYPGAMPADPLHHLALQDPYGHSRPVTGDSLSRPLSAHPLHTLPSPLAPGPPTISSSQSSTYGTRGPKGPGPKSSASSQNEQDHASGESKQYNFVATGGQAQKRPRRRFDEIERLYDCDYPGCTKAYGTLNHLNSHKTMQKHGPKSTPAQFKELRKAWRENKKRQAAEAARKAAVEEVAEAVAAPRGGTSASTRASTSASTSAAANRPRPQTAGGEYHYAMQQPQPHLGGGPAGMYGSTPLPLQQPQIPLPHHPGGLEAAASGMYANGAGAGAYSLSMSAGLQHAAATAMYGTGGFPGAAPTAVRPLTAPHYFGVPAFGYSMHAGGHDVTSGPLSRVAAHHGGAGGGMFASGSGLAQAQTVGMIGPPPLRRMSLPGDAKSMGMFSFSPTADVGTGSGVANGAGADMNGAHSTTPGRARIGSIAEEAEHHAVGDSDVNGNDAEDEQAHEEDGAAGEDQ